MVVYALIFCAGFLNGPTRCTVEPGARPQSLKECKKIAAQHQRSTGPGVVKLPNRLVAVRRWECIEKPNAEGSPVG
jgi:hypothetical protein